MKRIPFSSAAAPVAILGLMMFVAPGGAAGQGARPRGGAPSQGQAVQRGQGGEAQPSVPARQDAPAPSQAAPQRAPEPQRDGGAARQAPPRVVQPRSATAVPRTAPRVVGPSSPNNDHPVYRPDNRPNYRPSYRPQYRPDYRPAYRPNYRPYYRPYYTFQPRLHLRFGLWSGYPVAYPYYMYPAVTYPYPYGYSVPPSVYAVPGAAPTSIGAGGGLSFDINPPDARIYVDGQYAGIADQFSSAEPPLALAPGRHRVEIHASGFEVIAFDVDILPGQVIPYQGDLRRF